MFWFASSTTSKPRETDTRWREEHSSPISTSRTSKWWSGPSSSVDLAWANTSRCSSMRHLKIFHHLQYVRLKWRTSVKSIPILSRQVWKLHPFSIRFMGRKIIRPLWQIILYYRRCQCIWMLTTKWEICLLIPMAGSTTLNSKTVTLAPNPSSARKHTRVSFPIVYRNLTGHQQLHQFQSRDSKSSTCKRWPSTRS